MKLTHDLVRALRDSHREELCAQHDAKRPEDCSLCGLHAIGVALCEEWLARRTVRWAEEEPDVLKGDGWFGHVHHLVFAREWTAYSPDRASGPRTEAAAREWLEAKAREAGYEIEGDDR